MTNSNMNCEALDAALPDFLEGTLDDSRRSSVERHLRECVRCMSLVRDIESIRKEAQALPDLVPARDLWEGIEARIAAPVIALAARPEQSKRFVPVWMGIAAAALVVSTAGVTYLLTARSLAPAAVASVAGNGARSSLTPVMATGPSVPDQQAAPIARGSEHGGRVGVAPTSGRALQAVLGSTSDASRRPAVTGAGFASQNTDLLAGNTQVIYAREISALQSIVRRRKAELDSSTVAIIERNLEIIDAAIEKSKAALEADPASLMLSDQLTRVLDKKVELLRTAALLAART